MKLFKMEITLIVILFVALTYGIFADNTRQEIADKLIRLHVVANSDEAFDQNLKLEVKDDVLNTVSKLTEDLTTKQEVIAVLYENFHVIEQVAREQIIEHGYDYDVKISLDNEHFPTKYYENFALPAGNYDGLKIEIGEGDGENWWCVVFPPVCNEVATGQFQSLNESEIMLITQEEPVYKIKFKTAEIVSAIKNMSFSFN